ncbi:MAG: T9SS type A sorting domain-containing protein [Bacteroidia bacterium]|nr:T9SS type A sorting domain-containing protein [Bacteroidia bacterium]
MLRLSTIILLLSATVSLGQIKITNNHMPSPGDKIEYSTAISTSSVDVSTTGANSSWDFSSLTAVSNGVEEYKRSVQTPYLLSFGFTALGKKLSDTLGFSDFQLKNIYNFYRNSSGSFSDVGIGFQFSVIPLPQAGKHSDPDEIYVFPLEYGNRDSTTFEVEVPISAGIAKVGSFFRKGNRVTTVDGWGKISTPYVTNEDCIRLKSVISEKDSIAVTTPSINFGTNIQLIEYKWLSTTEKIPLLTIVGNEIAGNFIPTSIIYRNDWSVATPIVVDFDADKTWTKKGNVVSLTNKSTGDNLGYSWSVTPSTGFLFVNGTSKSSENPKLVFNDPGFYTIELTASNGSNSETTEKKDYIEVADPNSSVEQLSALPFKAYPNPVYNKLVLTADKSDQVLSAELLDLTGKRCCKVEGNGSVTLSTRDLPSSIYTLRVFTNSRFYTQKISVVD